VSELPEVGIGIVGHGIMGKAHSYAYSVAPRLRELPCRPRLRLMSGRNEEAVRRAAGRYGVEETVSDWHELVGHPDVDVVDVCTPPGTHAEIVAAAAAAGKAVLCEKPLSADYASGLAAVQAVTDAGVLNTIGFNYRRLPAVSLMRAMIAEGRVGEVLHFRATWLSDEFLDPSIPFDWRFERRIGASTISDLGAHLVDLALWMVGDIDEVSAQSTTFTKARSNPVGAGTVPVDVDDASAALATFASGARGTFEMSRTCARRPCDFSVEVNGTRGTLRFEYPRLNELWYGDAGDEASLYGMRQIRAEHESHPYAAQWWPIGQGVGYDASFANQAADMLSRWPDGPWDPDLQTGLRVQAVCEAMERAAEERRWVGVSEIGNATGLTTGGR
jgi:predicted dehydrogenase